MKISAKHAKDPGVYKDWIDSVKKECEILELRMLPEIPLHRFFDRSDPEKQLLYKLIMEEPDPEKAMENYRNGLKLICSQESYD